MQRPPSPLEWRIDSEMHGGHTVEQVIAWQSACEAWAERHAPARPLSSWVISPRVEPRAVRRLRRLFGR
jgi:hypothetical protein